MEDPTLLGPRSHKKSKNGCVQCKKRKIKCDENHPQCNNCVKHQVSCTFELIASSHSSPRSRIVTKSTSTDGPVGGGEDLSPTASLTAGGMFSILDMELLHNFTTSTCFTLSKNPVLQTVWRVKVPQLGFLFEFVMHGILAVSALHFAHARPKMRDQYVSLASRHHETGLRSVTALLSNITQDNCPATYVFTALTCIISCATPREPGNFFLFSEAGISEWLRFFRGTKSIVDANEEWLVTSSLGPMFSIGSRRAFLRETSSTERQDYLIELCQIVEETVTDPSILRTYTQALLELRKSYAILSNPQVKDTESADVFIWLFEVEDDYLALLAQRTPQALTIFAYYCVLLKQLEWTWYTQGISNHLISAIWLQLGHEHRCWIQFPIEQIGWVHDQDIRPEWSQG